jgi:hypothetical protein
MDETDTPHIFLVLKNDSFDCIDIYHGTVSPMEDNIIMFLSIIQEDFREGSVSGEREWSVSACYLRISAHAICAHAIRAHAIEKNY